MSDERPEGALDEIPVMEKDAAGRDQDVLEAFPGPELTDPWANSVPEAPPRSRGPAA